MLHAQGRILMNLVWIGVISAHLLSISVQLGNMVRHVVVSAELTLRSRVHIFTLYLIAGALNELRRDLLSLVARAALSVIARGLPLPQVLILGRILLHLGIPFIVSNDRKVVRFALASPLSNILRITTTWTTRHIVVVPLVVGDDRVRWCLD